MSDKAIYSVDTVETITDNDKIYVNTGDNIKQVKKSDLFIDINSNLVQLDINQVDLKMLGWTVPSECPIQNEVSGNQFIQKVGRVDLASLTFNGKVSNELRGIIKNCADGDYANIFCYNVPRNSANKIYSGQDGIGVASNGDLYYKNGTNAPSGYAYYELATPITMTIDGNEATERINESLDEHGLLNKFNGNVQIGFIDKTNGRFNSDSKNKTTDYYTCVAGDVIYVDNSKSYLSNKWILIVFCNDSSITPISFKESMDGKIVVTAPENATRYIVSCTYDVSNLFITVNNEIEQIKNDLGGLKFSASGTTLTITDGTNTWTLEAN